jgi:methionyl aminopeptidase
MNNEDWITAGKITNNVRNYAKKIITPNIGLFEAAEKIESKIKEQGAIPAFPVNLSINSIAAHYTPIKGDNLFFENNVVKVDIGVCYKGAIGDSAFTLDFNGGYTDLLKASKEALKNASKIIQIGTTLGEIGKTIQETINSYGFVPIKNLSGHGLDYYKIHSSPQIPNYNTNDKTQLEKGMKIAIEPFATNGIGLIKESGEPMIFSQIGNNQTRDQISRKVLKDILEFKELPFALRYFGEKYSIPRLKIALKMLKMAGNIKEYPPLVEEKKGIVSQEEHSYLIDDKVIKLTDCDEE